MQILRAKGGGVAKIMHIPINKLGMERADENGDINNVYYCDDWTNPNQFKKTSHWRSILKLKHILQFWQYF